MRKIAYLATAAGLILFISLIVHEGVAEILAALSVGGWNLLWIIVYYLVPMALSTLGWYGLISRKSHPPVIVLLWARWIGESFNTLLPVAQVGGHVVRAQLVTRHGVTKTEAGASVIVDFTLGVAAQFVFALMGTLLLFRRRGGREEITGLLVGIAIGAFLLLAFYLTQRIGLFSRIARFIQAMVRGRELVSLAGGTKALDQKIEAIYQMHGDVLVCSGWRLLSWIAKTGESWLVLYFLGVPVTLTEALIMESLSAAVGSAAFMIPGALGVKEGGIMVIGNFIGISPGMALALALAKRVRELLIGIPGLITWMVTEGRRI